VLDDGVKGAWLVDALPNIDFVMSMILPSDVPLGKHEPYQMVTMLCETTKPVVFVGETEVSTVCAIEMAAAVVGGVDTLSRYPHVINYINPMNALRHNKEAVRRLLYAAERNVPSVYAPANTRGTFAPMTPAGALALGNAGHLAGLVLSQLKREGSPFIRSSPGGQTMDMRTMVDMYVAPDDGPMGWDLAHYYGVPIFGTAGCSDSKVFDAQAAGEVALNLFANTICGANLIHDVGYLDCAMTYSYELLVYGNEIIGWLKRYLRPPEINEETLALDLIHEAGHDGRFLESKHTLDHVRNDWQPTVFDRFDFHRWAERGSTTLQERANQKVREILENHRPEPLPDHLIETLETIRDKYVA
jgi:trimethylamine--corrinoid protein Co-methyltransferase